MKTYKSGLGIRGDMMYCPLPLYIDSYWTCSPNCYHCFARQLNRTWGQDFRKSSPSIIKKRLLSKRGTSPLSMALKLKKTIKLGNRSDPFQKAEETYKISTRILKILNNLEWETVIQTKFPNRLVKLNDLTPTNIVMPVITPGLEKDWEIFERKRTENPLKRLEILSKIKREGIRVGVNGEPFIPGYHTVGDFEDTLRLLKSHGIKRYNTYNLHLNDLVAKNLNSIGLDIEKIWYKNKNKEWRKILIKLIELSEKYNIILGCPDFVNSGNKIEKANTCCGVDVKNPCTFNSHFWKKELQKGRKKEKILNFTWEEIGNKEEGFKIINGTHTKFYTLNDIKE